MTNAIAAAVEFCQRGRRGYSRSDAWSLDNHLAGIIAGGCRQLANNVHGCPVPISDKHFGDMDAACLEWAGILRHIAAGFARYNENEDWDDPLVVEARGLLAEWFPNLWD